ncbi:MAG: PD-(D/E)XK nuclease family protein [Rhodocyclaceae bacterium]|nr:PD-(D/E)XK nuclease family protein [Rhodocyclaceae bacterium]
MKALFELPVVALSTLQGGADTLVLAPTARLATELRRSHGEHMRERGLLSWRALDAASPAQWLDHLCSAALLAGDLPAEAVPGSFLTRPQEQCLWSRAVASDLAASQAAAALFDHEGLARCAFEADTLVRTWRIAVPELWQNDESQAFSRWRAAAERLRREGNWVSASEAMQWRMDCLARGVGKLPATVALAGFVAPDPMLQRLLTVLAQRGVVLVQVDIGSPRATAPRSVECLDADQECQAAAAWAAEHLARSPHARLRIACADWAKHQYALESALDAALHADAVGAAWTGHERRWERVGGVVLGEQFLADVAVRLLQTALNPRQVMFADVGALLCGAGWSSDVDEADLRAQCEASLRERVAPRTSLERIRRLASADLRIAGGARLDGAGAAVCGGASPVAHGRSQLLSHLELLSKGFSAERAQQTPGQWARVFERLLVDLGWPGQRALNRIERETCARLRECLAGMGALDRIAGRVSGSEAHRLLRQSLKELSIRVPRQRPAAVEIGSLDEILSGAVDGLWLMGLNEAQWPGAPRPNPLLPAFLQRQAGVPMASSEQLTAAAERSTALFSAQAESVVFSWSRREGERELRPSALLAGYVLVAMPARGDPPLAAAALQTLHDAKAPEMDAQERQRMRGGTALLAAQAICPAWTFYQFRLGAAVLPAPTSGLDARARGSLLHSALEYLWQGKAQADVAGLGPGARAQAITQAVDMALAEPSWLRGEPPPPRLVALERNRLIDVIDEWLQIEAKRPPFVVEVCEARHALELAGLPMRVVVDRVDRLADDRLVIIDYKSGRSASADSWADERIGEPQLPMYAALLFPASDLAAVALARVVRGGSAFLGVAGDEGILPGVKPLAAQRRRYDEQQFPDWESLRRAWADRLEQLAEEIVAGVAAVVVAQESALVHCPVTPLLRLAERRNQFESGEADDGGDV